VLRSEDGGHLWQHCTTPPGAEKLDFRGIQAFDANTAIVMSSGPGDLSRLYKTTDGCQTWTLIFTNPDKDGFWDDMHSVMHTSNVGKNRKLTIFQIWIAGDPVNGRFTMFGISDLISNPEQNLSSLASKQNIYSLDGSRCFNGSLQTPPDTCPADEFSGKNESMKSPLPKDGEALFAASNSSFIVSDDNFALVTGGLSGSRFLEISPVLSGDMVLTEWRKANLPLIHSESGGAFSIALSKNLGVIVGGDYLKPNDSTGTAAFTVDGGKTWTASTTPPHGYRSAVAYDASTKTWITVGPNGTDISTDDGRNWRALKPGPSDPADADQHWNALSLPFVVGPHGRIGVLNPAAIKSPSK
jgi:photosystem II stability/assembly factor-like uncharacterized protein